ncbi:ATP-binding protein [Novosphingobium decolorationis]|uniref:ATP-binding protein n=1 Tax=Novosphingobium decolorationis TaxID=2698673 RepID=A0ABX8E7T1_9SPHN|nr:ATP-binding protein [Novosphingobium decolorationis]QVM85188.1 ATP-binding protein [Novosphingobium decolorationis]
MNLEDRAQSATIRTADATPYAASLIQSLRDIGYSCETALADIVDNSITAGAGSVEILSDLSASEPSVAVLDDGRGMTADELVEAMRPGSRNPLEDRHADDLGRFGLGLKSASFSQCKRLTVLTRRHGVLSGATWDLDAVARTNRWEIELHDDFGSIPWHDRLTGDGTLVIWRSLDRLWGGIENGDSEQIRHVNRILSQSEHHLRLVFHRFMSEGRAPLTLLRNGRRLDPIDPFGTKLPGHQYDRMDRLEMSLGTVEFQAHTLPHHSGLTKAQWDDLGGPEGHLRSQGFYVYRGRRLIIAGSWLGLARQLELTKLCRVRVDIPNTMDPEWKIDVKKASAQLPPKVRERMRRLVENLPQTSKRTYQRKGRRLVDQEYLPIWSRIQKDGGIIYRPDPAHPLIAAFSDKLPMALQDEFATIVAAIGSAMPVASLHADFAGNPEDVRADDSDEAMLIQYARALVPGFVQAGMSDEEILDHLHPIELFRSRWDLSHGLIRDVVNEVRNV